MDGQKPDEQQAPAPMQFAPGDTIRPQQEVSQPATTEQPPALAQPEAQNFTSTVTTPEPAAPTVPQPQTPVTPTEQPQNTPLPAPTPSFYAESSLPDSANSAPQSPNDVVTWTASEFIAHQKNSGWYALLMLGAVIAAVLVWFITKDIVSAVVIIFAGAVFGTFAARKPRQLSYRIDPSGLTIGQRHYSYNEFRSFSVVPEGAFSTIVFAPLKRFGTLITLYYDPQDEERIIDAIMARLPHEERKPDPIDRMLYRIRF